MNARQAKITAARALRSCAERLHPSPLGATTAIEFDLQVRWHTMITHRYRLKAHGNRLEMIDELGFCNTVVSEPGTPPGTLTVLMPDVLVRAGGMPAQSLGVEFDQEAR